MILLLKQHLRNKRHYIFTFCSQMFALFLSIWALKLAAITFDPYSFGLYNIVRRIISMINFPLLIGLGISIPIYIAKGKNDKMKISPYILTALLFWFTVTTLLFVVNIFAGRGLIVFLFNSYTPELLPPLILNFSALYLYSILYAIYRGEQDFWRANLFQIVAAGLMPVLAIRFCDQSVLGFLLYLGIFWMSINLMVLYHIIKKGMLQNVSFSACKMAFKDILWFGLPRLPGEFALFGLMAFPLFFIAKTVSMEKAGSVAVGFTLVQLVASIFEFMGTILLPKTVILISENRYSELGMAVKKILFISVIASIIISSFIFINLNWLLDFLDKGKFTSDISEINVILYCIPFYIIYIIVRNPLDAIDRKPYNMYNLVFCFIVQMLVLFLGENFFTINTIYSLSVVVPLTFLGIFTFLRWNLTLKKYYGEKSINSCC